MTDDLNPGFNQETASDSETTETSQNLSFSGAEGTDAMVGQGSVPVDKPGAGETVQITAESGQTYVLNFDPSEAQTLVEGDNLVLLFADGSKIVFVNLVELAQQDDGPSLVHEGADMIPLLVAQGLIPGATEDFVLTAPGANEVITLTAALGQNFVINFDPAAAQITVDGDDLVLVFANGGRIVIEGLNKLAGDPDAPTFDIDGNGIPALTLLSAAGAGGGDEGAPPTIETAAGDTAPPSGGIGFDFAGPGDPLDLLNAQGVIPPVERDSDVPDLEPGPVQGEEEAPAPNTPPSADPVLTTAEKVELQDEGESLPEGLLSALFGFDAAAVPSSELESFFALAPGELSNDSTEGSGAKITFNAQVGDTISFDWNFLTNENTPDPTYNDTSFAILGFDGVGINGALLANTEFLDFLASNSTFSEETGYFTFEFEIEDAGAYFLGFGVVDVDDTAVDSGLLIDNFQINGSAEGFESGTFSGWEVIGDASVVTAAFGVTPTEGVFQGLLTTGDSDIDPSSIVFYKELTVDGAIGDGDDPQADFGGSDAETALGALTFTLLSQPAYGSLILVSGGGSTIMQVGDTFTDADTVWWIATDEQIATFLGVGGDGGEEGESQFVHDLTGLPGVTFDYSVTDEDGNVATAPVVINLGLVAPIANDDEDMLVEQGYEQDEFLQGDFAEAAFIAGNSTSGNVLDGTDPDPDPIDQGGQVADSDGGAPSLYIASVEHDGSVYDDSNDLNPYDGVIQFETALGGSFEIDVNTGFYTYYAPFGGVNHSDDVPDQEVFTYKVLNGDWLSDTADLTIIIKDTGPEARPDEDMVVEGGTPTNGNVLNGFDPDSPPNDGNQLFDIQSADFGLTIVSVSSDTETKTTMDAVGDEVTLTTLLGGELVINLETGFYSYTPPSDVDNSDGNPTDQFSYTIEDSDGSQSTTTLTIEIKDTAPEGGKTGILVDEDDLAVGNNDVADGDNLPINSDPFFSGTLSFNPGADSVVVDFASMNGDVQVVGGSTLTYAWAGTTLTATDQDGVDVFTVEVTDTATGDYTFTLLAPLSHPDTDADGNNDGPETAYEDNLFISLEYTITDSDGDVATGFLGINVDDDSPVAVDDDGGVVQAGATVGEDALGGVLSNDEFGADGGSTVSGLVGGTVGVALESALGFLTLNADGSYSYTAKDGVAGIDVFTYEITDGDGDTDTATLTFNLNDVPSTSPNPDVLLDDDALAGGNPGGIGDDVDAENVAGTLGFDFGGDGAGSVAWLTTGAPAGFTYELSGDDLLIKQGGTLVLTVTLNTATGDYTVTQNAPIDHVAGSDENNQLFSLTYQVTDGDGDTADGTMSINVDDDTPTVLSNDTVLLDDDALAGGNPGGTGDDPDAANTSGTLSHSFGADGAGSIAWLTTGAPAGFTYEASGDDLLVKQGGVLVLTVTLNTATGDYTVTQNAPIDHVAGLDENNQLFSLTYQVTDGDGDTADGTLAIDVDDDTPVANDDTDNVVAGFATTGNVITGIDPESPDPEFSDTLVADDAGADGGGTITGVASGEEVSRTGTLAGGDLVITTDDGTLAIFANGSYTYTAFESASNSSDVFTYTYADGDFDTTTATLTINTAGVQFPSGLAYTVAGGAGGGGPANSNLYAVDLESGATVLIGAIEVDFGGFTFNKLETTGLTLNPADGFLYGVAKDGNFTGIIKIDPITAEAVVIVENAFFNTGAAGLSFESDGTLWIGIGDKIGTVDLGTGVFTEVKDLDNSISVDGFAVSADGLTAFFGDGIKLYKITNLGTTNDLILLNADIGISLDALSFDDNGNLWGADNQGTIISIDQATGDGTVVSTIANNEITSSGLSSLGISIEDPGTYISVAAASLAAFTVFVDQVDFTSLVNVGIDSGATGITEFDTYPVSMTANEVVVKRVDDGDAATVDPLVITDTTDLNPDNIDEITIRNDDDLNVTINGFDNVTVLIGGGDDGDSSITVSGATTGALTTGVLANSEVTEIGASADSIYIFSNDGGSFDVKTGAGSDTITLDGVGFAGNDATLYTIDGGTGDDTLILLNEDGSVNLDLRGIENIDLTDADATSITLSPDDVLDTEAVVAFGELLPLTHEMTVDGDNTGDTVFLTGTWTDLGGGTYTSSVVGVSIDQFDINGDVVTSLQTVDVTINILDAAIDTSGAVIV